MSMTQREIEILAQHGMKPSDFEKHNMTYEGRVEALIRERYSSSDEHALNRQRFSKPQEFAEYDAYCEECKRRAKAELVV